MIKIRDLKKDEQFNNSLIRFFSIIFHPEKYPLPEQKVILLSEKLFADKNLKNLIIKDLQFTEYGYYIDNSIILKNEVIINALFSSKKFFVNPKFIWAFSPLFNKQDDAYDYLNKLLKELKKSNGKSFCRNAIKEINFIKYQDLFKQYRRYDASTLSIENYSNVLEMYRNFDNWGIWYEVNPIILKILDIICNINKNSWYETITKFSNPVIIHALNDNYKRINKHYKYLIPENTKNISNSSISLIILNYIDIINKNDLSLDSAKRYFKQILDNIDRLNYKKFYWYGVLLDFLALLLYNPKKDKLLPIFQKQLRKTFIKNILIVNNKKLALKYFTQGFKNYFTNISYRHLNIYENIEKKDKYLANYIRKLIIDNYIKSINNEKFYAPLGQDDGIQYTNAIIGSICGLVINKQLSAIKLFDKLLNSFFITEEDYLYNSSEMIGSKRRIMQFFTVMFYCIETLQKTKNKISKDTVDKYFDLFIKYINLHTWYADDNLKQAVDAIFKLDIVIDNNILSKEIEILMNMSIPSFSLLAILISKAPQTEKAKQARSFLEKYFNKYNIYWVNNGVLYKRKLYEEWFNISLLIKNKAMAFECLKNIPNNIKENFEHVYKISFGK